MIILKHDNPVWKGLSFDLPVFLSDGPTTNRIWKKATKISRADHVTLLHVPTRGKLQSSFASFRFSSLRSHLIATSLSAKRTLNCIFVPLFFVCLRCKNRVGGSWKVTFCFWKAAFDMEIRGNFLIRTLWASLLFETDGTNGKRWSKCICFNKQLYRRRKCVWTLLLLY